MADEVKAKPLPTSEIKAPDADEMVALYCRPKRLLGADDIPVRDEKGNFKEMLVPQGYSMQIAKAGQATFTLYPGQWSRMLKSVAEWHVAKHRSFDHRNPLELIILTIEEAQKMASKKAEQAPENPRDLAIKRLIDLGVIKNADEATGMATKELEKMVNVTEGDMRV